MSFSKKCYSKKQVQMNEFDMISNLLYSYSEAELSAGEGAISVIFPFPSIQIVSFTKSIFSHVDETSSERLKPVLANSLTLPHSAKQNVNGSVLDSEITVVDP